MIGRLCLLQARAGICSAASLVHSQPQLLCLHQQLQAVSAAAPALLHISTHSSSTDHTCSHSEALPGCSTCAGTSSISSSSNSHCTRQSLDAVSSSGTNSSRKSSVWHRNSVLASRGLSTSSSCWQAIDSSTAGASRSSGTVKPTGSSSTSNSSSSSGGDSGSSSSLEDGEPKFQVPPAVAAGAAAAGDAAAKAAKAAAKQASRLVKLVQSTSLSEAAWLQLSSIWQSHSTTITAVTAAAATAGVYHLAAGIAGQFVDMAVPTAFWTCLSASAAAVAVAGIQIRSSFMVDPERVYRITMRKLNRHAGLQEVMGAPLAGSDVRLELVSQGSLFVQETLLPKRRAPRIHLMFQLTGPTKTGVVSVVAKKAFGSKYAFRTLMVQLPDQTLTSKAAAAAGTAALARAKAAQAQANRSSLSISSSSSGSSSSGSGSTVGAGDKEGGSSGSSSGSGGAGATAAAEPARIYIVGAPASSSSISARHTSPTALLEDLKDPLLYALKHNLVGYEAEDETEDQLAWSKPQQDPDQTTWWDDTKSATKLLACRAYSSARKAGTVVLDAASKVGAKLRASAAASAAATTKGFSSSSSSSGGGSSGGGSSSSSISGGSSSGPGIAGQPAALTTTTTTTSSGASSMSATTSNSEGTSSSGTSSGSTLPAPRQ